VDLVQQPVQGLGQDGQPAVVLDQLQAGGQGFQGLFQLGAGEQARLHGLGLAGLQRAHGGDHAGGVQVVAHLARVVVALDAVTQQPGAGEVVLHHGHVAAGGGLLEVELVLVDVLELDLLVLGGVGVDGRAGEGGVEGIAAVHRVAVTQQLQVQLGGDGGRAGVHHLVLHADVVGAALEGEGLDQLHAVLHGRLEAHLQLVLAVLERALAGLHRHHGLVRGVVAADQAGLRHVDAAAALVEQHEGLAVVAVGGVLQQLGVHQRTALAVKGQAHHVGGDGDLLAGHRGGVRATGHVAGRRRRCSGHGRRHFRRLALGRRGGRHGRGEERGLLAVVDLPFVPQQNHGKAKYHPQNGAANVVHEDFFGEEEEVKPVNSLGGWSGTGSCPPSHHGWQRTSRRSVK